MGKRMIPEVERFPVEDEDKVFRALLKCKSGLSMFLSLDR